MDVRPPPAFQEQPQPQDGEAIGAAILEAMQAELEQAHREKEKALQRAEEAEARATEEACKVNQLSQEKSHLTMLLTETETTLGQRLEAAERSLAEKLKAMDAVLKSAQAERDQLAWELREHKQSAKETASTTAVLAERKQIVEEFRALKGDVENSLERRLEAEDDDMEKASMDPMPDGAEAKAADEQELIANLARDRDVMAAQLEDAWGKIEEQQRTIEEDRATFWEELDLMRADRDANKQTLLNTCMNIELAQEPVQATSDRLGISLPAAAPRAPTSIVMLATGHEAADTAFPVSNGSYLGSHAALATPVNASGSVRYSVQRPVASNSSHLSTRMVATVPAPVAALGLARPSGQRSGLYP